MSIKLDTDISAALDGGNVIIVARKSDGEYTAVQVDQNDVDLYGCVAPTPSLALYGLLRKLAGDPTI
jgi:hypothetical protein